MSQALFAFENCQTGESAARELLRRGLEASRVQVHRDASKQPGHSFPAIDEQVTGGLITNLLDLFRGVLEWGSSPHDASAFEETIRRGGSVVSVDAATADNERLADEVMAAAGADRRTPWSNAPVD